MGNCPKCKAGTLRPITFNSSNWVCGACGYSQFRPSTASSSVHNTIKSNRDNVNNAMHNFNDSINSGSGSSSGSDSGGFFGKLVVTALILWVLYEVFLK